MNGRDFRRITSLVRATFPVALTELPPKDWPFGGQVPHGLERVFRSRSFLVQDYQPTETGHRRLSIVRTRTNDRALRFRDTAPITWDELMEIKRATGYGTREAVEIFPPDDRVVDVSSMRHLWILPAGSRMPFSW